MQSDKELLTKLVRRKVAIMDVLKKEILKEETRKDLESKLNFIDKDIEVFMSLKVVI